MLDMNETAKSSTSLVDEAHGKDAARALNRRGKTDAVIDRRGKQPRLRAPHREHRLEHGRILAKVDAAVDQSKACGPRPAPRPFWPST